MSDLENPHYHRKAGYAMIMVAASLAAIGVVHVLIGEDVLLQILFKETRLNSLRCVKPEII